MYVFILFDAINIKRAYEKTSLFIHVRQCSFCLYSITYCYVVRRCEIDLFIVHTLNKKKTCAIL